MLHTSRPPVVIYVRCTCVRDMHSSDGRVIVSSLAIVFVFVFEAKSTADGMLDTSR